MMGSNVELCRPCWSRGSEAGIDGRTFGMTERAVR